MKKQVAMLMISLALLLVSAVFLPLMKASASIKETAVVVKLTLPGGKWIEARVIENGFLKVQDEKTGQTTGFSMEVLDKSNGTVRVKAFDFGDGNNKSSRELETLEVAFKSPKTTSALGATNFEVLAVAEQLPEKDSGDSRNLRPSECCVTCEGLKVCSNCRVTMSCGSCSTDRCPE